MEIIHPDSDFESIDPLAHLSPSFGLVQLGIMSFSEEYFEQMDITLSPAKARNRSFSVSIKSTGSESYDSIEMDKVMGENVIEISKEDLDLRMKTAAVMLAQLYKQDEDFQGSDPSKSEQIKNHINEIRSRLIHEMMELEAIRISSLEARLGDLSVRPMKLGDRPQRLLRSDKEDPSAAVFKEPWALKRERIRVSSPFGKDPNWDLVSMIVKTGADLRQEQLALQIIREISLIWKYDNIPVWVHK